MWGGAGVAWLIPLAAKLLTDLPWTTFDFIAWGVMLARHHILHFFGLRLALLLGAVVNFLDTLGIGSMAPAMAWFKFRKLVPDLTADRIDSSFAVSADADGLVSVTVAWPVKKGQCLDGSDNEFCTFTLRSRL